MARPVDEFNPWPAFVDLFASIIMVVLVFLLVLIVNVAFYSQYKYKIAYTGSVDVGELILEEIEEAETLVKTEEIEEKKLPKEQKLAEEVADLEVEDEIKTSGVDLTVADHEHTRQENIINLDWMIIKFSHNELILDPATIKELEKFIADAKKSFPKHQVEIFISEPQKQVSATIARQIGLSRALNIRNLIRKQEYKKEEVLVRLRKKVPTEKTIEHDAGYIVVNIMKKGS